MPVIPVRLGEPPRQLFALMQPAGGATPREHGVLLCNPFGQEAIRAHRLVRVLGDRLASAGFTVMRFDYFGTGDSDGDDTEGNVEAWIEDIVRADHALGRLGDVRERSWFGIRLGASLAAMASCQATPAPARLVLWDPVTDGGAYLRELAAAHQAALRTGAAGIAAAHRLSRLGAQPPVVVDEALGFPLTADLRARVCAITPATLHARARHGVDVIVSADRRESAQAMSMADAPLAVHALNSSMAWAVDKQMNSAVVPPDALTAVLGAIKGSS